MTLVYTRLQLRHIHHRAAPGTGVGQGLTLRRVTGCNLHHCRSLGRAFESRSGRSRHLTWENVPIPLVRHCLCRRQMLTDVRVRTPRKPAFTCGNTAWPQLRQMATALIQQMTE